MRDDKGLYYYPFPKNKGVRMYVREVGEEICFRLWKSDDPEMWKGHGWVPYAAVKEAASMYKKTSPRGFDPGRAYDLNAARALVQENKKTG